MLLFMNRIIAYLHTRLMIPNSSNCIPVNIYEKVTGYTELKEKDLSTD